MRSVKSACCWQSAGSPCLTGLRLHTLESAFVCATAESVTRRIDGTETQVRRSKAHRPGRRAFVSGKRKQMASFT